MRRAPPRRPPPGGSAPRDRDGVSAPRLIAVLIIRGRAGRRRRGSTMTAVSSRALSRAALTTLVREIAADEALWRPQLVIPEAANRWWTLLSVDADVDVWLLSWLPGHVIELIDYGDTAAAFQ